MSPKRSRSGPVIDPVRVVAPTRVNRGQVEPDRPGGGALPQHDVELEVLHRRVEHLFDRPGQAVDLVDEQHVAVLELGEDGRQVAGPLDRRARRGLQVGAELGGDDAGQRGLAQPRRAGEQQVVGRLAAPPRRLEHDPEVGLQLGLAHELGQAAGPERGLGRHVVVGAGLGIEQLLTHGGIPPPRRPRLAARHRGDASCRRAWRSRAAGRRRRRPGRPWQCGSRRPSSPAPPARRARR